MKITSANFFVQAFQQQNQNLSLTTECQVYVLIDGPNKVRSRPQLEDAFHQWRQAAQNRRVQTQKPNQDLSLSPELKKLIQTLASSAEPALDEVVVECLQDYLDSDRSSEALLSLSNRLFLLARQEYNKSAS